MKTKRTSLSIVGRLLQGMLFFLTGFSPLAAQPTGTGCTSPIVITTGTNCQTQISLYDTAWFSFVADTTTLRLQAINTGGNSYATATRIDVFMGSCSTPSYFGGKTILPNDTAITYDTSGYTLNAQYLVRVTITQPVGCPDSCPSMFDFCKILLPGSGEYMNFVHTFTLDECGLQFCQPYIRLNQRTSPTVGAAPQSLPANLPVTCLPAKNQIYKAFMYFITVGTTPSTYNPIITNPLGQSFTVTATIAGNGVGIATNGSTCWNHLVPATTTSYVADITNVIAGNGNYTISNIPTSLSVAPSLRSDIDGITFLILYRDLCPTAPETKATIHIFEGLDMILGATSHNPFEFYTPSPYTNYTNATMLYSIGDVEAQTPNNTTNVYTNTASAAFWEASAAPIQFNQITGVFGFFHVNNYSPPPGGDCSSIPYFAVYYQDVAPSAQCLQPFVGIPQPDQKICGSGYNNLSIGLNANVSGGVPPYTYNWQPASGLTCANCQSPVASPSATTTYTMTATDANGCTFVDDITVIVTPPINATIVGPAINNCNSGTFTYTAPCQPGITYSWTAVGGTLINTTACATEVNWINPNGGVLLLTAFDPISDCFGYDTILIPPCCTYGDSVFINNRTASSVLGDPQFVTFVTGSNFHRQGHITINGIFTIDVPFTFLNCPHIDMGANAQIQVMPGQTLTFDNSDIDIKCGQMWDGIYVNGITAKVRIINTSNIQQARNAVVSVTGGIYEIENATLRNNYKSIVVQSYQNGAHAGYVRNTNFTMNSAFLPAFPPLPFGHTKTVCAVEITNNLDITVGDAAQIGYLNTYSNVLVGIRSVNSRTKVVNSQFSQILTNSIAQQNVLDYGTAIVAEGGKPVLYQPRIQVGGLTQLEHCQIANARYGLVARNNTDVFFRGNTLTGIRATGTYVNRCALRTIGIVSNRYDNSVSTVSFQSAIEVLECYNAFVNISTNSIYQRQNPPQAQVNTGIKVSLASPGDVLLNIYNNTPINRVRTGIWLINLVGKNKVYVSSNTVNFFKPNAFYTTAHYGIRLEGCATVRCDTNRVTRGTNYSVPNLPTGSMFQNLRGISIENSPGSLVTNNVLTRMGCGVYGWELSGSSTLACNTMDHCYNGVLFAGSSFTSFACDIGDQIIDPTGTPAATGNTWNSTISSGDDINGSMVPAITWRYSLTAPLAVNANGITISQTNYDACATFYAVAPVPTFERDKEVGTALRLASQQGIGAEQRYQLQRFAHRRLTQTPAWLSLNTPDDTLYQNFFASYNPTTIGTLRQIEEAADTGNAQYVGSTAASLPVNNTLEQYLKQVYSIYADSWMQGVDTFTSADSATLQFIAGLDPVAGGTAVYNARVMLNYPVDYYGTNNQRIIPQEEVETSDPETFEVGFALYPNPASESVTIEFQVDEADPSKLEIRDIAGKVLISEALRPGGSHHIATAKLSAGVYFLQILQNKSGHSSRIERLVIIK